jgi:hypothetical protein
MGGNRGKRWSEIPSEAAWTFIAIAAFPKLAHRLRWPTRLGPRGLLLYIALSTALGFTVRGLVVPWLKRVYEQNEQAKRELRQQLGREPTAEELASHSVFQ